MFLKAIDIAPARVAGLLEAAEAAARAIPPAFPLSATVAVNPFLGQTGEDLATAAARLARVAGVRLMRPRAELAAEVAAGRIGDDDLAEALIACASPLKPADLALLKARLATEPPAPAALPTLADLVAGVGGTDWPAVIARAFGLWAAGQFDLGQALWSPAARQGAYAAWREWATHDLTPEIAGLTGFCAHVAAAPDTAARAVLRASERLGLTEAAAPTAYHRLLMDLGGWAQHARWLLWQAELAGGSDTTLTDLLAIRLVWEEALLAHAPEVGKAWAETLAAHEAPVAPTADQVLDAILQEAAERAHQRRLAAMLNGPAPALPARPALQAAFCIDVRSEVFRRALESLDPGIETIGFAGFFGLPLAHLAHGTDEAATHLPVLLNPGLTATSHAAPEVEQAARIAARTARAWGRFRQAAVSSFAFVEAAGPLYGAKLVRDALGLGAKAAPAPAPRLAEALPVAARAATAAAVLKAMSLSRGHAPVVLLVGHGAQVANNPHESAYHCGACGGQTGEVSARLLASLLNDPETRAALPAQGIALPEDTVFVAGLHDTTTDTVTLHDTEALPAETLAALRRWLAGAAALARAERAARLPGATALTIADRARNWAEVRPEWGLAGCAAFVAAPRAVTAGADLQGRAFLHSYDWAADPGFATLELILTAPVVVASWISLQYYGSAVAPEAFGGGNKLIHNVTGGIGVVQGNGGILRPGLPWQAVHDGARLVHEPLRLSVLIEAPTEAMSAVLARHPGVRALFDNGWLHLFALQGGRVAARYRPGLVWQAEGAGAGA
ncbi:MAG: YbcC family protein [Gemmobacter sp.]|uniref:YbcC family protein n=1 Tax=Gemmobacter sp. TaxID=1898957 RepID=UPI00391B0292